MLSNAEKNIIIHAFKIRHERGENVEEILKEYNRLTDAEKYEVLRAVGLFALDGDISYSA